MNHPINFASKQIADSDSGCKRQVISGSVDLAAGEPYELNLSANSALKFFGDPKGVIVLCDLDDLTVTVASTNQSIPIAQKYVATPIYGVDGDRIIFESTAGGMVNFIITDFEIDPIAF